MSVPDRDLLFEQAGEQRVEQGTPTPAPAPPSGSASATRCGTSGTTAARCEPRCVALLADRRHDEHIRRSEQGLGWLRRHAAAFSTICIDKIKCATPQPCRPQLRQSNRLRSLRRLLLPLGLEGLLQSAPKAGRHLAHGRASPVRPPRCLCEPPEGVTPPSSCVPGQGESDHVVAVATIALRMTRSLRMQAVMMTL